MPKAVSFRALMGRCGGLLDRQALAGAEAEALQEANTTRRPPVSSSRWRSEGRLADGTWHALNRCWWRVYADGERRLRLLPAAGPADGAGVVSDPIVAVKGAWMVMATADEISAVSGDEQASRR